MENPKTAALFGALVADAASMGLHWLYDVDRIAMIVAAQDGRGAFTPVDPVNFDGAQGYFAHAMRPENGLTQYGEVLRQAIRVSAGIGGSFSPSVFQSAYGAHFGPGGAYVGYIDRPTRGTLDNIAAGRTDPSGIDDDQLPALATLPAVVVAGDPAQVEPAIRITNVNPVALAHGVVFADLLGAVLAGVTPGRALRDAAGRADEAIRAPLLAALDTGEADSTLYGAETGRACHLPMAMPLIFHILARAGSYADAVERNIAAGGDSAGRAIAIGAVMGACHGIATPRGVPLDWALRLRDGRAIRAECARLGAG